MEAYGIDAEELGDECYRGKLQAYQKVKNIEKIEKVVEETSVEKIPRYVPKGVKPRDHTQRGVNVAWPFKWGKAGVAAYARAYNSGDDLHSAFDIYRRADDSIIPFKEHPRLFPFSFEDYKKVYIKREHPEHYTLYEVLDEDSELYARIEAAYEHAISEMRFKPADVRQCFDGDAEESTSTTGKVKKPDAPLTVKKRASIVADKTVRGRNTRNENKVALVWITYWRSIGKSEKEIAAALSDAGAENPVIGYLLAPEGEDLSTVDSDTARKRGQRARQAK